MTGVNFFFFFVVATQCLEQEISAAKIDEIEKWKGNHVFEPIYYNGQKAITTRWVLAERFVDDTWICWTSYKNGYAGLLVLHLLLLLNPWLIVKMWPA